MTTFLLILLALFITLALAGTVAGVCRGNPCLVVWWCFGGAEALVKLLAAALDAVASGFRE